MFWMIIMCLLALVAIGFFADGLLRRNRTSRQMPRFVNGVFGGVALLIAVIVMLCSCLTTVDTKNVGVVRAFGHPEGYLGNGLHFVAPWQDVTEINDAVQTDTYASDNGDEHRKQGGATDTCVHVRIERQATACVNVSIRWQIIESAVPYLFRNYKDNAAITDNLVLRDLQQALNEHFVSYDPLAVDAEGLNTNKPLTDYSNAVQSQMRSEIGSWIDVKSVIIPIINYDADTQTKVHQLLQQIALTRVAEQAEQTAKAQALANRALADSVSNDPNVLTDKCLNILKESVDKGVAIPAGFSCFAGTTSGVAVAVPPTPSK